MWSFSYWPKVWGGNELSEHVAWYPSTKGLVDARESFFALFFSFVVSRDNYNPAAETDCIAFHQRLAVLNFPFLHLLRWRWHLFWNADQMMRVSFAVITGPHVANLRFFWVLYFAFVLGFAASLFPRLFPCNLMWGCSLWRMKGRSVSFP